MEKNNENRIPFNWELYQTGDYDVVCRDERYKPIIAGYNPNATVYHILGWVNGVATMWNKYPVTHLGSDLFLIPKQPEQDGINVVMDESDLNALIQNRNNIKQPKSESDLISFDWEKYKTGQYDLLINCVFEGLIENPKVIDFDRSRVKDYELIYQFNGKAYSCSPVLAKLRKKKQKFHAWVNLFPDGESTIHPRKEYADSFVSSTEKVEQRLVEWEA